MTSELGLHPNPSKFSNSEGALGKSVHMAFLGDLMLVGEWRTIRTKASLLSAFGDLRVVLNDQDLVFANLETTIESSEGHIPKQPRVISDSLVVKNCLSALRSPKQPYPPISKQQKR